MYVLHELFLSLFYCVSELIESSALQRAYSNNLER